MKIALITPAAAHARNGNRNTAQRWASFLRQLGHRVVVQTRWDGAPADLMLALHARRSHDSVKRFASSHPGRPLVVVLTGTDLYRDIRSDETARESLRLATRLVVLQEKGPDELAPELRPKTRVIYQSAAPAPSRPPLKTRFQVCVVGHLREEKDPFRCAYAMPLLPAESRIAMIQIGRALDPEMEREARELMRRESRYKWLGELPHWQARRRLAQSRLMVISSRMEGGANVICEAVTAGVPVIASAIPGNIGMLGRDYEGYFPLGDEKALAQLLRRAETDTVFYRLLQDQCTAREPLFRPEHEKEGLRQLLEGIATSSPRAPTPAPRAGTVS